MTETILIPEKELYVQRELEEAPLVLAIYYKEKKSEGVFFSSRSQRDSVPWFEISPPDEFEPSVALIGEEPPENAGKKVAGIIAGVGNRSELETLVNTYKMILFNEINTLGL